MTVPLWMLLGFAAWTVLLLLSTVGVYRWSRNSTGSISDPRFPASRQVRGRGLVSALDAGAHVLCIENLPVFGAYCVLALYVAGVGGSIVDLLSISVSSCLHRTIFGPRVSCWQTNNAAVVRFAFFLVQLISFLRLSSW